MGHKFAIVFESQAWVRGACCISIESKYSDGPLVPPNQGPKNFKFSYQRSHPLNLLGFKCTKPQEGQVQRNMVGGILHSFLSRVSVRHIIIIIIIIVRTRDSNLLICDLFLPWWDNLIGLENQDAQCPFPLKQCDLC